MMFYNREKLLIESSLDKTDSVESYKIKKRM